MAPVSLRLGALVLAGSALVPAGTAMAQAAPPRRQTMQSQLDQAMALIRAQQAQLDSQALELKALRARLDAQIPEFAKAPPVPGPGIPSTPPQIAQGSSPGDPATVAVPLERVGQAPEDDDRPIDIAVLDSQGSVVTRRGALTGEVQFDYARADRARAVFRGIELAEVALLGVFDINESRQDVITASASLRYGITDRFEVGVRLPYVYRSDKSVLVPISDPANPNAAATIDSSAKGNGIGDLEVTARYQLLGGGRDKAYLIGNLQAVIPTGTDPFNVRRDSLGRALNAATGAGFYGITPSVTAILPSDPVVLFGTLGYTFNLGKKVDTQISTLIIDYVDPGDSVSASAGIGISFNERTTVNFGYAHTWAFGTKTRQRLVTPTMAWPGTQESTSRDLQIGRFLFGVTYRVNDRASINWSVEVGATEDATDLRTVLRIPLTLLMGG